MRSGVVWRSSSIVRRRGCDCRTCASCARARMGERAEVLQARIRRAASQHPEPGFALMFVTLTMRTERAQLERQVWTTRAGARASSPRSPWVRRFLSRARTVLGETFDEAGARQRGRRHAKRGSEGGACVLEFGKGDNAHAHALVWGPYVPKAELNERWTREESCWVCESCGRYEEKKPADEEPPRCECGSATRDHTSVVVDIQAVRDPERASAYVAKYLAKPCDGNARSRALAEWSMTGTARTSVWGSFRCSPKRLREEGYLEPKWRPRCGTCGEHVRVSAEETVGNRSTLAESMVPGFCNRRWWEEAIAGAREVLHGRERERGTGVVARPTPESVCGGARRRADEGDQESGHRAVYTEGRDCEDGAGRSGGSAERVGGSGRSGGGEGRGSRADRVRWAGVVDRDGPDEPGGSGRPTRDHGLRPFRELKHGRQEGRGEADRDVGVQLELEGLRGRVHCRDNHPQAAGVTHVGVGR